MEARSSAPLNCDGSFVLQRSPVDLTMLGSERKGPFVKSLAFGGGPHASVSRTVTWALYLEGRAASLARSTLRGSNPFQQSSDTRPNYVESWTSIC